MKAVIIILLSCVIPCISYAQIQVKGKIMDQTSLEPLARAHITTNGQTFYGTVSNQEGDFFLYLPKSIDTINISYLGYRTAVLNLREHNLSAPIKILMEVDPIGLTEVVVKPRDPLEILREAVKKIPANYENKPVRHSQFFRQIIRDSQHYYAISEGVFGLSVFPEKKARDRFQLELIKGRTSEDVSKTRLFENLHWSGGPLIINDFNLVTRLPNYLDPKYFDDYEYFLEDNTTYQSREVYVIDFDQKADIEKALQKGKVYIDKTSHAIIRLEAAYSLRGLPYLKHLTGTDKMFAKLLNIDLKRLSNSYIVNYEFYQGKWHINDLIHDHEITYKQPKKGIDLHLFIHMDALVTGIRKDSVKTVPRKKRWHKRQLIYNQSASFDENFWGENNHIKVDAGIREIVNTLEETKASSSKNISLQFGDWEVMNEEMASVYFENEDLLIQPYVNGLWLGEFQGPMVYQWIDGDFELITNLEITQSRDQTVLPDKGFQMAGLILRNPDAKKEEHALLSLGTRGSSKLKLSYQLTKSGKSKSRTAKFEGRNIHLRIVRQGGKVDLYSKEAANSDWSLLERYHLEDLPNRIQVGMMAETYFGGKGPNMFPDMLARFKHIELQLNSN